MINEYIQQIETANLFPSRQQVCHRMAKRGLNPREHVISGHAGEVRQSAGMTLLAAIHDEIGDWKRNEEAAAEEQVEIGLTSEINTNLGHISLTDTLENIAFIFQKNEGRVFEDAIGKDEEVEPAVIETPKPTPAKVVVLSDYALKLIKGKK